MFHQSGSLSIIMKYFVQVCLIYHSQTNHSCLVMFFSSGLGVFNVAIPGKSAVRFAAQYPLPPPFKKQSYLTDLMKMAIYSPQGSGTLRLQLLMMHWLCSKCLSMPEYVRVGKSMPEYAKVCQGMQEYSRVSQSMPEYARVCQSMPEYARVSQSMP